MSIDNAGAVEECGQKRFEFIRVEVVDEFLAGAVHFGSDDDGQIQFLSQFYEVIEVFELLIFYAGGKVSIWYDINGGDASFYRDG